MRPAIATGVAVGVLAGLWAWASAALGLPTWVGVVSWAAFFAAGGALRGALTTGAAVLSGVAWGWLGLLAASALGGWVGGLAVAVAVIAFAMCAQSEWRVLGFVPGAFLGAASLFGNSGDVPATAIALVVGVVLGLASERVAGLLAQRAPAA